MLAEEYILIDISLIICSPSLTNKAELQNNINCSNFTQQRFGLTNHGISVQQKALNVSSNFRTPLQADNFVRLFNHLTKN